MLADVEEMEHETFHESRVRSQMNSPFQATKLWNNLISSLRQNIETKKKRWKMKTYDDCFTGSEAVHVLLAQMQLNSKSSIKDVTAEQACQLLQKFLDSNIIKDARVARGRSRARFEADGHLYKFCDSASSNKPDIRNAKQQLQSQNSLENTYNSKASKMENNLSNFGRKSFRSSKRKPFVSMTNLGLSPNKKERRASLRSFCNDGLQDSPMALDENFEAATTTPDKMSITQQNQFQVDFPENNKKDELHSSASYDLRSESNESIRLQRQGAMRMKKAEKFNIYKDCAVSNHTDHLRPQGHNDDEVEKCKGSLRHDDKEEGMSPRKRKQIYSETSAYVNYAVIASAFENISREDKTKPAVGPLLSGQTVESKGKEVSLSCEEMEDTWKTVAIAGLRNIIGSDASTKLIQISSISARDVCANGRITKKEVSECVPLWLLSAMKCLIRWPSSADESSTLPSYPGFERDVFNAVKERYQTMITEPLIPRHFQLLLGVVVDMINENWLMALAILKYICVLLPHKNRLHLQLLTRFINKLSRNDAIQLSLVLLNRELLVQTFHQFVFVFNDGKTDIESIRLLTFMLDNSEEIFKLPRGLRFQVDHKLAVTHGSLTHSTGAQTVVFLQPKTYCKQVTVEDYEKEGKIETQKAMEQLLDRILEDDKMSPKEKKQFLRQFQKTYPDIYNLKVTEDNMSTDSKASHRSSRSKFT